MFSRPPVLPRKPSRVQVTPVPKQQLALQELNPPSQRNEEREVEILNHCFDDIERFMVRLQQAAEAQSILSHRKKKSRKSKKPSHDDDLITMKAVPPSEDDFVGIFQKIKYSFSLLDRVKSAITEPKAPRLLHHIFFPLQLMVKTTCGPQLGGSVVSPALTTGAVSLLREHLTEEEKQLWTELGPNWTCPSSQLGVSVPPYSPVFLDGWQPQAFDSSGLPLEDPVESQHKQDANVQSAPEAEGPVDETDEVEGNGLPPPGERHFCCSYDFVARNSSELSVLQGETLEMSPTLYAPLSPPGTYRTAKSPTARPQSMVLPSAATHGDNGDRVLIMNDELLQRMAQKRISGSRPPLMTSRSVEPPFTLNYQSPASEVESWLVAKGFSQRTVQSLGVLTGAQLFSLNKKELCEVSYDEGARVYSHIMMQKVILEDAQKVSELEKAMERQKLKIGMTE